MPNLYEVESTYQQILSDAMAIAEENGGVIPEDTAAKLDAAALVRDDKVQNCIKFFKNEAALADMVNAELAALKARIKAHERAADWMKQHLSSIMPVGQKLEYGCGEIGWRASSRVIIDNPNDVPEQFIKVERSVKVKDLGDAIKSGDVFDFAHIETFQNIQIR
jgi:Siphovirus Gp157